MPLEIWSVSTKCAFCRCLATSAAMNIFSRLNKVHDVAKIVAGLKSAKRVLLRHHETKNKRQ